MVAQAALFVCVNVLFEDCRSEQSETRERENRISKMMWGSKVEAAEHSVPAQPGDFYFRALFKGHLRMKNNNNTRWKYCQCLEFCLFLFVEG